MKEICNQRNLFPNTAWKSQDAEKRRKIIDKIMRRLEIDNLKFAEQFKKIGVDKRDNIIDNRVY